MKGSDRLEEYGKMGQTMRGLDIMQKQRTGWEILRHSKFQDRQSECLGQVGRTLDME